MKERDEPINISSAKVVLDCVAADWDVLIEIQDAIIRLPDIKLQHVEGHQDRTRAYQNLSQLEQLNVDADRKVSNF